MTRLKDATFESNAITGTDAYTSSTGSPTVDATSIIKGTYAARHNWTATANVNGTVSGLNASELWYSFYIRVAAYPSSTARILRTTNGNTQFNITMGTAGALNVRMNATSLQTAIATLSLNTTYRIGIHIKCSTADGNSDAVIDVYVVTGDTAFGAATYSNSAVLMNVNHNNWTTLIFGHDNAAAATGDMYFDSIRIDDVSMPASDGGANTPKSVTVTVTDTISMTKSLTRVVAVTAISSTVISIQRAIAFIRSVTVTDAIIFAKGMVGLKTITATVGQSISLLKNIGKPITRTVSVIVARNINQPKTVQISLVEIISIQKTISKPITVVGTIVKSATKTLYNTTSAIVGTSLSIAKNILKPLSITQVISVSLLPKSITKTISRTINTTVSVIYGKSFLVFANVVSTINIPSIQKTISKIAVTTTNTVLRMSKNIRFIRSVVSGTVLSFIKLLASEIMMAQINKNKRSITLSTQNTTLDVLGINRRTLSLKDKEDDNS